MNQMQVLAGLFGMMSLNEPRRGRRYTPEQRNEINSKRAKRKAQRQARKRGRR